MLVRGACECADTADGARGRLRGQDGSKHAGVTGWHVGIDHGQVCDGSACGSVGNMSSELGGPVAKKGPYLIANSRIDSLCLQ